MELPVVPSVSIIVPTFREAENLPALVPQVAQAMRLRGWVWEMIVVDDNSPDNTPAVLEELTHTFPQLKYIIRKNDRGLSSAVLAGIGQAVMQYFVVMDADLSHPPESVPDLVMPLIKDEAEFVIGSRYVEGGGTQDWSRFRWLNSAGATLLSRPFTGGVKDPMAGFFALRRETLLRADPLCPIGYKIGLELLVKCKIKRVKEVPILFRNRAKGESKLTLSEQFRYLEHLSRLYDYKYPKGSPRAKFMIAAGCGAIACFAANFACDLFGVYRPISLAAGLLAMIAVTAVFFIRYVRTQRDFILMKHPYSEFIYISLAELIVGWFFAVSTSATFWAAPIGVGLVVLLLVRYALRKVFLHDIRGIRGEPIQNANVKLQLSAFPAQPAASA